MNNINHNDNNDNNDTNTNISDKLTPAERHYKNQLKASSNYQKRNPEKIHLKNAKYYSKIKEFNNDQYNNILDQKKKHYIDNKEQILDKKKQYYLDNKDDIKEKKKLYYHNVVKPKLILQKQLTLLPHHYNNS